MLRIDVEITPNLVIFRASGPLSGTAIADAIRQNHRHLEGRGCLWDLREADFSSLEQRPDFAKISGTAREVTAQMRRGKVAYVVSSAQAYVTMCKYMNYSTMSRVPMEYAVFRDMNAAQQWLSHEASVEPDPPTASPSV
jgi:hypothetical protein